MTDSEEATGMDDNLRGIICDFVDYVMPDLTPYESSLYLLLLRLSMLHDGSLKENLRTCCLICNSVKSGKSFEEAAPLILKSMQERRQRRND